MKFDKYPFNVRSCRYRKTLLTFTSPLFRALWTAINVMHLYSILWAWLSKPLAQRRYGFWFCPVCTISYPSCPQSFFLFQISGGNIPSGSYSVCQVVYLIQSNYLSGNWENLEKPENAKTGGEIIRKYTFFKSEGLGSGTVCVKEFCGFWTLLDHCSGHCCKMCTVIQLPLQVKKFFHYCKYRSMIGEVCHTDMQTTLISGKVFLIVQCVVSVAYALVWFVESVCNVCSGKFNYCLFLLPGNLPCVLHTYYYECA